MTLKEGAAAGVTFAFFLRLTKDKIAAALTRATTATPPTTPPMMAPVLCLDSGRDAFVDEAR